LAALVWAGEAKCVRGRKVYEALEGFSLEENKR